MKCRPAIFLLLLWSAAALAGPALTDQYEQPYTLSDAGARAVLVIVADARKLRWVGKWEERLRKAQPDILTYRVAGVLDTPPPPYDKLAGVIRKRVPADVPIAIDLDNTWATQYQLDISEPCLLLFNTEQQLVGQWRGRPNKALLNEVLQAIGPYFPSADTTKPSNAP